MRHDRLLNKDSVPTDREIIDTIGDSSDLWSFLHEFISKSYDFNRELAFFSKNYGWTVRYRKHRKTLISCFPEDGAFSVLLVLGKKEAESVCQIRNELNQSLLSVFDTTDQLHDGRWLWIRVKDRDVLDSVIKVLMVKRKPKIK